MSAPLFHFTCADHGKPGIDRCGYLRPNYHPILDDGLVWATDLDYPFREALGLTSALLSCDRTAHRYEIADATQFVPWLVYARKLPEALRADLESAPGAMPRHWWVSREVVPVVVAHRAAS